MRIFTLLVYTLSLSITNVVAQESLQFKMGTSMVQGLFRPHQGRSRRGLVILFPDSYTHMDWPQVMHPLAVGLNKQGWASLSLNLMHPEAKPLEQLAKNLEQSLKNHAYTHWVIVGYGSGSRLAQSFYLAAPTLPIKALVLISADLSNLDAKTKGLSVLDIIASGDSAPLRRSAQRRKQWSLDENLGDYQQWPVEGADHGYTGLQQELVIKVRSWLHSRVKITEHRP